MRNEKTIKLIRLYQKHKRISGRCHFIPSCSNYAIEAYQKFNWFYASILTGFRILRCTPFTKRRVDLVPLTKDEKKQMREFNLLKQNNDPIYLDLLLKHKHLKNDDLLILTIQYLYGYNFNFTSELEFDRIENLGLNFVKTKEFINQEKTLVNIPDTYILLLEKLNDLKIIEYTSKKINFANLIPSSNYPINYYLHKTSKIPLSMWKKEIERYFNNQSIIGFENIDHQALKYFTEVWDAEVISSENLTHKYLENTPSKIIIVTGDNLVDPKILFHLNCIVRFFDENEEFSINNYNLYIPKERGE
ncbi:MAG: membrane protein insertion efficiency factor YidD [Bacilli bacterium]|nr:membrane protein insertion efficiency factor YidD [Bacilli bacterium]